MEIEWNKKDTTNPYTALIINSVGGYVRFYVLFYVHLICAFDYVLLICAFLCAFDMCIFYVHLICAFFMCILCTPQSHRERSQDEPKMTTITEI